MMAFIGTTAVGGVAVPMNAWWTTEELDYGFADSGAKIVVADRARVERLLPIVEKARPANHRDRRLQCA